MIPTKEAWENAVSARHGAALQKKISSRTVAVCGLGGLGSNIALALARTGIGKLILIDFDRVDIPNLHRQQYMAHQVGQYKTEALSETLRKINPYLETKVHTVKLTDENTESLLKEAHIICEAFDNAEAKASLVHFVMTRMPEKYIVSASGMAGMGSGNTIKTRKVTRRFYLCGDGESDIDDGIGLMAPRVMLCAAHQALTVLRIIAGEYEV